MLWREIHKWTPAEDERLRLCIADGLSRSQIAERMGLSTGAVCGRIFRLGLQLPPGIAKMRQFSGLRLGSPAASAKRRAATALRRVELGLTPS